jgi:23S rRNA pseudouridine2605 synthase
MKERLQKIISSTGAASRREAESWIAAGEVAVDGVVASLGDKADPATQKVTVRGKSLDLKTAYHYILLNKPAGYLCTRSDPQNRALVYSLITEISSRLFTVGRLDLNTEGVILLTDDGGLCNQLTHPRYKIEKTYLVRARGKVDREGLEKLGKGVLLEDGMTAPARVENVRFSEGHTWLEVTIHEGRNRQIRRMMEAIGHSVSRLKRIRFAFLEIGNLKPGQYRVLTKNEISRLERL